MAWNAAQKQRRKTASKLLIKKTRVLCNKDDCIKIEVDKLQVRMWNGVRGHCGKCAEKSRGRRWLANRRDKKKSRIIRYKYDIATRIIPTSLVLVSAYPRCIGTYLILKGMKALPLRSEATAIKPPEPFNRVWRLFDALPHVQAHSDRPLWSALVLDYSRCQLTDLIKCVSVTSCRLLQHGWCLPNSQPPYKWRSPSYSTRHFGVMPP